MGTRYPQRKSRIPKALRTESAGHERPEIYRIPPILTTPVFSEDFQAGIPPGQILPPVIPTISPPEKSLPPFRM